MESVKELDISRSGIYPDAKQSQPQLFDDAGSHGTH
jgi:hypothetical protein